MSDPRPVSPEPDTGAESVHAPPSEAVIGSPGAPDGHVLLPEDAAVQAAPAPTARPGASDTPEASAGLGVLATAPTAGSGDAATFMPGDRAEPGGAPPRSAPAPGPPAAPGPAASPTAAPATPVYWLASAEAADAAGSAAVDGSRDHDAPQADGAVPPDGVAPTDDGVGGPASPQGVGGPASPQGVGDHAGNEGAPAVVSGAPTAAPSLVRPQGHGVAGRSIADRAARWMARLLLLLALMAAAGYGLAMLVSRIAVDQTAVGIATDESAGSSVGPGASGAAGAASPARSGRPGPSASARAGTASATRVAASTSAQVHVVARGETLAAIAARYGVTVQQITAANGIVNPDLIYVGQRLVIPVP